MRHRAAPSRRQLRRRRLNRRQRAVSLLLLAGLAAGVAGVEYEAGETLYGRLTAETTDLYADWNGLQTRLPDTGGILRRSLAGLLLAGGGLALWTVGRRRRTE